MHILSAEEINLELKRIAKQYSGYTRLTFEGYSEGCRPIYSISVGNGAKTLVCSGGVHGRESINPTVLVKMTEEYCAKRCILKDYRILILPLANPDGYEIALNGFDRAQTAIVKDREKAQEWKYNARMVDINRNFPCKSYRAREKRDFPLSEAESRILAKIFQRENSVGYLDFHSRGQEIYWHRGALDLEYNKRQKKIAQVLCQVSGYRLGTPEDEMQDSLSGGNTVQFYSEQCRLPAITVETVAESARFPLGQEWLSITHKEIKDIPLTYLSIWDSLPEISVTN